MNRIKVVGVIGSEDSRKTGDKIAEELGKILAQRGFALVCGGRRGIMQAASKGVVEAGGLSIGILPENRKDAANPYIKLAIPSGIGFARNHIIVHTADVLVAIEGHYGTLSEIASALNLGKIVIGLYCNWHIEGMIYAKTPLEAADMAEKMIK